MSAPNLIAASTITGKTAVADLTTVTANIITNSAGSNSVDKLENVILTNYTSSPVTANVMINRGSTIYYVCGNASIAANSTVIVISKNTSIYLEEGDVLQANVSANSSISVTASYELIAT